MGKRTRMRISILIVLIMAMMLTLPAMAEASEIKLVIDGTLIRTDVAPYLHNNRTLVPVRVIAERLGADVDWEQSTEKVTIQRDSDVLILTIGSPEVFVNGRKYILDTEPLIREKRTMVPIRFISERLGATVFWDGKTNTVYIDSAMMKLTDAYFTDEDGESRIVLKTNDDVAFVRDYLEEDHAIRVTLPGIACGIPLRTVQIQQGGVRSMTTQLADDGSAQVLIHLEPKQVWREEQSGRSYSLALPRMVNALTWGVQNGLDTLMISTSGKALTQSMVLQEPWRAVVDLERAILSDVSGTLELDHEFVERIRYAQHDTETVRVVADLAKEVPYRIESDSQGVRMIFSSLIQEMIVHEEEGKMTVTLRAENGLAVCPAAGSQNIVWNIPDGVWADGAVIRYLHHGEEKALWTPDQVAVPLTVSGEIVQTLQVASDMNHGLNLMLGLKQKAQELTIQPNGGTEACLEITPEPPPPLSGKIIVLDPGHGGSDPGAIGPQGTLEKDVNLAVGLKLKSQLVLQGARVIMTRDRDEFISLTNRAALANESGADLFISIHANGFYLDTANGTETYYCTDSPSGSAFLAQNVHSHLVNAVQLRDRGVKTASYTVLKETAMPSALVEIAFITHPNEEQLLCNSAFQEQAAQGICQGILAYFQTGS